ncbi:hypothetical protein LZ32DRAFT_45833 [Colletotrichum eremochloae]|nr:hypothetical protein LZ32DRAFT_45833 [Colletotrichum eremochloae]
MAGWLFPETHHQNGLWHRQERELQQGHGTLPWIPSHNENLDAGKHQPRHCRPPTRSVCTFTLDHISANRRFITQLACIFVTVYRIDLSPPHLSLPHLLFSPPLLSLPSPTFNSAPYIVKQVPIRSLRQISSGFTDPKRLQSSQLSLPSLARRCTTRRIPLGDHSLSIRVLVAKKKPKPTKREVARPSSNPYGGKSQHIELGHTPRRFPSNPQSLPRYCE